MATMECDQAAVVYYQYKPEQQSSFAVSEDALTGSEAHMQAIILLDVEKR